ncbi:DUF4126 family protein [Neorhizobium sp. NCHU2750]|uniref:DUF4126 family protein n=1 Tax=Neorhizobium sp. NCHU2750 TaxID=1825976 RepID=UPI000E76D152|nr:membrane protein [Neorhizobium sp. NCHU2750]
MVSLLALFMGIVAGLRAMMAPALVSWAASLGWLDLSHTWLSFMGSGWAVLILTILAILELVTDQLPNTPSRKVPQQFVTRLLTGGLSGAAICIPHDLWLAGLVSGVLGAVVGTYGGAWARAKLAASFGKDPPAAFIEDGVAFVVAFIIILSLPGAAAI